MNNEAQARRKAQPEILGKAKVMSYEDIEAARAKHAEKDAAKEAKGKGRRGRMPKSAAPELGPEAASSVPKDNLARMSEIPGASAVEGPNGTDVLEQYCEITSNLLQMVVLRYDLHRLYK